MACELIVDDPTSGGGKATINAWSQTQWITLQHIGYRFTMHCQSFVSVLLFVASTFAASLKQVTNYNNDAKAKPGM